MTPTETWNFFSSNDSVNKCARTIVFSWHKRFRDGIADISDDLRPWRPRIFDGAKSVQDPISVQRSIRDIADITGQLLGNVRDILTTQQEITKVCARWVHAAGGTYSKRNERHVSVTLINRRRQNDVPKCSVRLYHPNFICILQSQYKLNMYDLSPSYRGSVHLPPCLILFVSDKRYLSYGSSPGTF